MDVHHNLKEKLTLLQNEVEAAMDTFLPPAATRPANLHAAMRYSMEAGGKRLRPVLLLAAAQLKPAIASPLPACVAIECLHTYTLIHDDLPSVDNSDLRRGRPACHKKFDEPTALLAGDALLTYAFELLASEYQSQPKLAVALIKELAFASGSQRLIGGQMEDIENENKSMTADSLEFIHQNKTAALLQAALQMGGHFFESNPEHNQDLGSIGFHLGMAFQIIDDILDVTASQDTMGKPVGSDAKSHKSTYPDIYGLDGARAKAEHHTKLAQEGLAKIEGDSTFLNSLFDYMLKRSN